MEKKGVKEIERERETDGRTSRQAGKQTDIHTELFWTLYIQYHTNFAEASHPLPQGEPDFAL